MSHSFLDFFSEPAWRQITIALVHSSWQTIVIALFIASVSAMIPVQKAALRFRVAMFGMLLFALCPLATLLLVQPTVAQPTSQDTLAIEHDLQDGHAAASYTDAAQLFASDSREHAVHVAIVSSSPEPLSAEERVPPPANGWQPYVVAVWLAGVCLLSLRLLFSSLSTAWLRVGRRSLPADLQLRMMSLSRRMRVPRARAYLSTRVRQAMVVGVLRPCILIPASWLTQLAPNALEAVLAHELAHLRRHDLWAVLFQRLIETLFFYHPAVWWLSRRIDIERELACDDSAVAATGKKLLYVQSLERVARQPSAGVRPSLAATIQGERKMKVLRRVRHVLGADSKPGKDRWWLVGLLVLSVAMGVWGVTTDAFNGSSTAIADEEGERRDGDREGGEREVRRDGDRERGEREVRRDGDREGGEREVRRDGDRERREGEARRDGEGDRDRPIRRDGDREGVRPDRDRREGDRPDARRDGDREGDRPRFDGPPPSPRERAMMQMIEQLRREIRMLRNEVHQMRGRPPVRRDGDRPDVRREGDRPDARRDGDRLRPDIRREGDRPDVRRESDRPEIRREGERDRPPVIRRDGGPDRPREGEREKPRGDGDER